MPADRPVPSSTYRIQFSKDQTFDQVRELLPYLDALGADFLACSPYKFRGPHCGVLAARPETLEPLHPDKLMPSANDVPERFELGTLDGMIGCVAADMGVTMLPRAVVGRNETVTIHTLEAAQSRVDTLFITRRSAHQYSALQGFLTCLDKTGSAIAA